MITYGSTTLTSYNTITKIEVYYYKSTSATDLAGGSWSTTKPTWENGKYIWQKIKTTYEGKLENGQFYSESDPVNITGQQGATGTAAYSYKLNASDSVIGKTKTGEYTIDKITFTATYKQGTGAVTAYTGRFKIETTVNGTTWTTQYTSSGNESSKEFTIPENIISVRCSLYQSGGTSTLLDITTIPVVKDGIDAVGLRDSIPYYLASDKQTGVTRLDQGWTRFKPELTTEKRYLWVYYVSRYSEGNTQPELIEIKNDIVSFENHGDESPVENCVIDIEPVQDLNGYDSPWPDGGGENLLGGNALLKNARDYVQLTTETDEYFQFSASATIDSELSFSTGITFADNTQYTFIFTLLKTTGVGSNIRIYYTNDTYDNLPSLSEDNVKETIVFVTDADKTVRKIVKTNQSGQTCVYYNECGVFEGVRTIADYTPYSNICPISGWTGAQVVRTGKNLLGGEGFRDALMKIPNAVHDPANRTVTFNAKYSSHVPLFEAFKEDTRYTVIMTFSNSVSTSANMVVYYTDGLYNTIPRSTEAGVKATTVLITAANKSAVVFSGYHFSGITTIYYDECGVFEGALTVDDFEPYTGNTYSITFPSEAGTIYGGELDVTNGVLTVDRCFIDPTAWTRYNGSNGFSAYKIDNIPKGKYPTDAANCPMSNIISEFAGFQSTNMTKNVIQTPRSSGNTAYMALKDGLDASQVQLSYLIEKPITYTLTPQEITMLTGQNHIFSDTGQTAISYYDNQTSTDPYVDYSATSAFEVAQSVSDTVGALQTPYKEVEWVESTGKQYIYTDWKPPIKTWGFEIDFLSRNATGTSAGAWNETTNVNGYGNIFGVRSASGVNNVQLSSYNKGLLRVGTGTNIATGFKTDHTRQTIKLHNNTLTKTDGTTTTITRVDEDSSKNYCNMTIFALYSDALRQQSTGSINEPSSTRIYSLKFYDGDTLTVDLVGAIRKADNVTGLYDKVTKHFYPAPGMLYGSDVGDIITDDTITENLNKTDVKVTVINKNRSRMWEANVPFHKLEDGQKLTVTYSYGGIVGSVETSKLIGWNDTSSNSNVYLKLTYPNGDTTEWIPCYYSNTARLTTHYGAGTPITFTYHENLLQNATETAGGNAVVRGFFANASYYNNTSYTQYSNNVIAGANGVKCNSLIMQDGEDTWSCFYSGAYKGANTGKPAYTGGFRLGKVLYSAGSGAQTSNSSLDTYYNYKEGVVTSTIYDAYPVDLRYSTNCGTTLTAQRPVYLVGTVENDGLFHLDISQWWTQTVPTAEDGKTYVYVGEAYGSYQVWLSVENPAYQYYEGKFRKLSEVEEMKAAKVADNYLSSDNTGIMVADMNDGNQTPSTATGRNVLIDNDSVDIRNGQKVVASFGETSQIGESDKSHMFFDYHSLQLIDNRGNTYFHVSDLRNEQGKATLTETFLGDGTTTRFSISLADTSVVSVKINDIDTSAYTQSGVVFIFTTAPADGDEITIVYETIEMQAKAYTFGLRGTENIGALSVAEGNNTNASGFGSHAEGNETTARGRYSHAEGVRTIASGFGSHVEGERTIANESYSHAEGFITIANESYSHAEGFRTIASGLCSHSEGEDTAAAARASHAQNLGTIASKFGQTALGAWNEEDPYNTIYGKYIVIIGNGPDKNHRSNALAITWDGDTEFALDTTASSGTTDAGLYDAITALGWENDVIV